jgi:LacI family transcriptional regulator
MATENKKKITIEDVARAASVGKTTVSFVFNNKGGISEKTRLAVFRAAEELGFEPNPHARLLANGRCNNTVILFSSDFDTSIGVRKIRAIQHSLSSQGFQVPIYLGSLEKDEDKESTLKSIRQQKPRAIICNTHDLSVSSLDELRRFQDAGGIIVCYDYAVPIDCDQVIFDRARSTYAAAKHLLQNGHRDIGLCIKRNGMDEPRLKGFQRACQEFNAPIREDWLLDISGMGEFEESGRQAARWLSRLSSRPSAICIDNDHTAQSFIYHLAMTGLRVPRDLSVVGHDDEPCAQYGLVPLTTMSHSGNDMVENVLSLLQDRLNGYDGDFRQITVCGQLKVRRSVGSAAINWTP